MGERVMSEADCATRVNIRGTADTRDVLSADGVSVANFHHQGSEILVSNALSLSSTMAFLHDTCIIYMHIKNQNSVSKKAVKWKTNLGAYVPWITGKV